MPTVEVLCHQDATAYSHQPSTAHNSETTLQARYTPSYYAEAFLKTSLERWQAAIPAGAQIDSANLMVFCSSLYSGTSQIVRVQQNSGNWTSDALTWNNRPGTGAQIGDMTLRQGVWISFNITNWAREAQADAAVLDRGLRITPRYDVAGYQGGSVYAIESGGTNDNPRFQVTYSSGGPTLGTANPNVERTATNVVGTNASGAQRVEVHYASSSTGPYGILGNATLAGDGWSYLDSANAPAPNAPTLSAIPTGGAIGVSWGAASQPTLVRYYKAKKILLDGTSSALTTSYLTGNLTPLVNRYILQRKRSTETTWITIYDGVGLSYNDTALTPGVTYQYRVQAINSQGVASAFQSQDTTVTPASAPTFDRVETTTGGTDYVLIGTGVQSGATINVYFSTQDTLYQLLKSEPTPTPGETLPNWEITTRLSGSSPDRPTFLAPTRTEGTLTIIWGTPLNQGTTAYFRVSQTVSGVESPQSATRQATLIPAVENFRLERKLQFQADTQYQMIFDFDSVQSDTLSYADSTVQMGATYIYRLSAKNSQGGVSPAATLTVEAPLPNPPTYLASTLEKPQPVRTVTNTNGTYGLRFAGAGRNGAQSLLIQRLSGVLWSTIKTMTGSDFVTTPDGEEWTYVDTPPVQPPSVVTFSNVSVDTDGIHLRWLRPDNPPSSYNYRAIRIREGVEGIPSTAAVGTIVPAITKYRLQRRDTAPSNLTPNPQEPTHQKYFWSTIQETTSLSYDDDAVLLDTKYEYRILAINNHTLEGQFSAVQSVETMDPPPPPPPPEEPPHPTISNARPKGIVDIAGGLTTMRLAWDYTDPQGSPQAAYKLKVVWVNNDITRERWWNGNAWITKATLDPEPVVASDRQYVDVTKNILELGPLYTFTLTVISESLSLYVEEYNNLVEPDLDILDYYTTPLVWTLSAASYYTKLFDTRRQVKRTFSKTFDLYRKVISYDPESGPSMLVTWDVEEELPLTVNDEKWEGGSNSWLWTVFDRDGRPEPYAELDFIKPETGATTTFHGDDRGRFNLKIPDDITPGIYTLRERGPSMAPRTIRNFPVVDPWLVYQHGHRHTATGDDPIFGITAAQIADNAGIHPSQIEGGASLAQIVDRFGSDILAGLEKHITTGHGQYVVSGLDPSYNTTTRVLTITAGVAWENSDLKEVEETQIALPDDDTWKIFVEDGITTGEVRADYPPLTTPIASIEVSPGVGTITDERLRHPTNVTVTEATPVRWGASRTEDIEHRGAPLSTTLDFRITQINDHIRKEEAEKRALYASNENTILAIDAEEIERQRARLTMLSLSQVAVMKTLYSMFRKSRAEVALAEATFALTQADADIALSYLQAMKDSGGAPNARNISAFGSLDKLSDLTTIIIRNGLATLPVGWTRGVRYTLRTLRVELPPSNLMELHLVYEDTGALFRPSGSLSSSGRYLPRTMTDTNTIKDDSLKELFNTDNDVYIKTYRCEGDGDEAVVDLRIVGGPHADGVRLRGWAITGA